MENQAQENLSSINKESTANSQPNIITIDQNEDDRSKREYNPLNGLIKEDTNHNNHPHHNEDLSVDPTRINPNLTMSRSRSRSRSQEKANRSWFYACCAECKKNDKNGKTCVCVVPASQRRVVIPPEGCSGCGCRGCTKEDRLEREKDEESDNKDSNSITKRSNDYFTMRNGCCRKCMKAFSSNGRACLCQVPKAVRKIPLPANGCLFCGCFGCNPEDVVLPSDNQDDQDKSKDLIGPKKFAKSTRLREKGANRNDRRFSDREYIDDPTLDNFNKSVIGSYLINTLNVYPQQLGFGVPQRTQSYIYGKPRPKLMQCVCI